MNKYRFLIILLITNTIFANINQNTNKCKNWIARFDNMYEKTTDSLNNSIIYKSSKLGVFDKNWRMPIKLNLKKFYLIAQKDTISIKAIYKSNYLKSANIILDTYDSNEIKISSDTLIIKNDTKNWETIHYKIKHKADYLNVMLNINGSSKKLNKQNFNLKELSIEHQKQNSTKLITDQDFNGKYHTDIFNNPTFQNAEIIGIGENIHSTETYGKLFVEIAKKQVLDNNCKLIALEIPYTTTLKINSFVRNEIQYNIDSLICTIPNILLHNKHFVNFFKWLKSFNLTHKQVHVLGIDINLRKMGLFMNLLEFVKDLNKIHNNKYINLEKLICNYRVLKNPKSINTEINSIEYENKNLLNHALKLGLSLNQNPIFNQRDKYMHKTLTFLKNKLLSKDDKILMYTHLNHVIYHSPSETTKLGEVLKKEFGNKYTAVGLLCGEGTIYSNVDTCNVFTLSPPTENFIENFLIKKERDYLYYDSKQFKNINLNLRIIGSSRNNYNYFFYPLNTRVEGIIFVKKVQPIKPFTTTYIKPITKYLKYKNENIRETP